MDSQFWVNKRVLLTGHTGFKGSWLALWLATKGAQVTGFGLAPHTNPSLYELADVKRDIESIEGDIRDLDSLNTAFEKNAIDADIHFAGLRAEGEIVKKPTEYYDVNVAVTTKLLLAIKRAGFKYRLVLALMYTAVKQLLRTLNISGVGQPLILMALRRRW